MVMWHARRLFAVAGLWLLVGHPALAAYETDSETSESDPFTEIQNVDEYVEERGEVATTTLKLVRDIGQALHNDHQKLERALDALKAEMANLAKEVRRLSADKSR